MCGITLTTAYLVISSRRLVSSLLMPWDLWGHLHRAGRLRRLPLQNLWLTARSVDYRGGLCKWPHYWSLSVESSSTWWLYRPAGPYVTYLAGAGTPRGEDAVSSFHRVLALGSVVIIPMCIFGFPGYWVQPEAGVLPLPGAFLGSL